MTSPSLASTQQSTSTKSLVKGSIIALSIHLLGIVLTYLLQVFLARWLGRTEYGLYEYVLTWSLLLAVPASLGLPRATVRFISQYRVQQEWGLLRGILLSSWQLTLAAGLVISSVGTGIIAGLNYYHPFPAAHLLSIGIWLVPLQALVLIQEDMGRGIDNLWLAYTPTRLVWPSLIIGTGFTLWHFQHRLSSVPTVEIALATLGAVILLQGGLIWWNSDRNAPPEPPAYKRRYWLSVALPLLLYRAFRELLTQTDALMLGAFLGADAVGLYSPAAKTALWSSFVLQGVNIVVAPAFSILHIQGDHKSLQDLISQVTIWIFGASVAVSVVLLIFPQQVLSLFGPDFQSATWELRILVVGHLINALSGSVGNLLSVTGYQKKLMWVSGVIAIANLSLNAVFIPLWGTVGAAITTTGTLAIWNVWLIIIIIKHLKINPTVFSTFLRFDQSLDESKQ